MQNLKENWLVAWKMMQGIWLILMWAVESLIICTLNSSNGKSENVHFDAIFLSKVCNVWAKKIQTSCVVKNNLWFQKWHEEFGEFSQWLKLMLDKSSLYNVLAEGMYFLDKCSTLNFNFSDFPLLVLSFPNSSFDFWKKQFLYKCCPIL